MLEASGNVWSVVGGVFLSSFEGLFDALASLAILSGHALQAFGLIQ